jgi:hypothetical protein
MLDETACPHEALVQRKDLEPMGVEGLDVRQHTPHTWRRGLRQASVENRLQSAGNQALRHLEGRVHEAHGVGSLQHRAEVGPH